MPWVGATFAASPIRTLILGESVYEWDVVGGAAAVRYAKPTGLRVTHANHAMQFNRRSPYVRNIERAIFATRSPTDAQKERFWCAVVYHNLVLDLLASKKHRPKPEQRVAGWRTVLEICERLGIKQCLVYGVESVHALKEAAAEHGLRCDVYAIQKVGGCFPRHVVIGNGEKQLKLLFVRHPSQYFSWKRWQSVIRAHLSLEFLAAERVS